MIEGVGTDLVDVKRIDIALAGKILSEEERTLFASFSSNRRKKEFLAGRFCLKEALIKALGLSGVVMMPEIVVLNDESGKPYLKRPRYDDKTVHISISHEKEIAVAFCVVERK